MAEKLVGQNYTPLDLVAKVTGRARYAEDFRADGMLFCKLLLSPMPHARVRRIDTSAALAMPGVKAILTADDLPDLATGARARADQRAVLCRRADLSPSRPSTSSRRPRRSSASSVDLEPLPFVVDPLEACVRTARTRASRATSG